MITKSYAGDLKRKQRFRNDKKSKVKVGNKGKIWVQAMHNPQNKTQENADTVEASMHLDSAQFIEKHVATLAKTIYSRTSVEAPSKQANPRFRETNPYMKCNKAMIKAGKTQKMKQIDTQMRLI